MRHTDLGTKQADYSANALRGCVTARFVVLRQSHSFFILNLTIGTRWKYTHFKANVFEFQTNCSSFLYKFSRWADNGNCCRARAHYSLGEAELIPHQLPALTPKTDDIWSMAGKRCWRHDRDSVVDCLVIYTSCCSGLDYHFPSGGASPPFPPSVHISPCSVWISVVVASFFF